MNEHERTTGDQNEHLDPKIHRDLAKLGWETPQTEAEVRAAEEWAAKSPEELPIRFRETPDTERSQKPSGLRGHYLRDAERHHTSNDDKAKDDGRSNRDLDR